MFDFELQMRFWRSVTDAMLHGTEASLAAASAMQDRFLAADKAQKSATAPAFRTISKPDADANPLLWWIAPWQAMMSAYAPQAGTICTPAAPKLTSTGMGNAAFSPWVMMPWMQLFWPQPKFPTPALSANSMFSAWGQGPAAALGPFAEVWPWSSMTWAYMQTPLTAMMMSAGMPFNVASPSAKASTAALDAAHAARQQIDNMYSAYRSDGGHAAAQIALMPWTLAATILEAVPAKATNKFTRH